MDRLGQNRLRRGLEASLVTFPTACLAAALVLAPAVLRMDLMTGWSWLGFTPDGTKAVLEAMTASMLTFIGFVVSSLLVVVQLASAQLTPRVIVLTLASRAVHVAVGLSTHTYAYTRPRWGGSIKGFRNWPWPSSPTRGAFSCSSTSPGRSIQG